MPSIDLGPCKSATLEWLSVCITVKKIQEFFPKAARWNGPPEVANLISYKSIYQFE